MPLPFNKALDLKLLKLVKDNPILYNSRHSKYVDYDAREVVWQKIGDSLNRSAIEFAGIQCQVCFGDFQEEKHKAGLIEDLREFLPEPYATSWGMEKKILKEHRKHQGVSNIEAKHLYTKTARDLPTYGVTFFLVKEKHKKGKKKMIPRLLGINAESILRLDEVTKEILEVWPLTHVKSYQVGKSETFSLNFGDYSDKDYCVKSTDAVRIRDILQGYIDIIGKRLAGVYNTSHLEQSAISEDNVMASRGNIIQHVGQMPTKIVEESFVGPCKILTHQPGSTVAQGTQFVTVQQMIVTTMSSNQQQATSGEVPIRNSMSMDFVRKLNRLNSGSVKIVSQLADTNTNSISEAKKILDDIKAVMPEITKGVKETAEKQTSEEEKKKLLDQLQQLRNEMEMLSAALESNSIDAEKAQDVAMNIANLSAQLYSRLDPKTQKRSKLLEQSRTSFIADEKTAAYLRRSSFLVSATKASQAVDSANDIINKEYQGRKIDPTYAYGSELYDLEKAAAEKMGKLNAAVAFILMAQADPNNTDYSAALTSMNTINELMPELAKDAQAIASCKEGEQKKDFLEDMKKLFEATGKVCSLTSAADHEKLQEISNVYSDVAGKLVFVFRRGVNEDQDNKIIDLAKDVGDKTSLLLMQANKLTETDTESAIAVDEAGVRCADAARDLLVCAMLTSPTIQELHCQSALTAAAETLSSSARQLMSTTKPLLEEPAHQNLADDELHDRNTDLMKALERLKEAYAVDGADENTITMKQQRLKFITAAGNAKIFLENAETELNKPLEVASKGAMRSEDDLAKRIAQLKSIVAALLTATSDQSNPDYASAELAVGTLYTLLPDIIKDVKTLSVNKDAETYKKINEDLKKLLDATNEMCASASSGNNDDLNDAGARFAESSNNLYYTFRPQISAAKKDQILGISTSACSRTSEMLPYVYQLAEEVGNETGAVISGKGAVAASTAKSLLTTAQLTAACMNEPRCQTALITAANKLSEIARDLEANYAGPIQDRRYATYGAKLSNQHKLLQDELEKLKQACLPTIKKEQRVQFIKSAQETKNAVLAAQQELNKPLSAPMKPETAVVRQMQLSQRMAQLNAAIAALLTATADQDHLDYTAAEQAVCTVNELLPQVVKEMRALSAVGDERSLATTQAELRALCDAARALCDAAGEQDAQKLNEHATRLANASGKLIYVVNPRTKPEVANKILKLSKCAHDKAAEMVEDAHQAAKTVGGDVGVKLDESGRKITDAARVLLTSAQLIAPYVTEPHCQSILVVAADGLSTAVQEMDTHCRSLKQKPQHAVFAVKLDKHSHELQKELETLRSNCQNVGSGMASKSDASHKDKERLQFIKTISASKNAVDNAQQELNKPLVAPTKPETAVVRQLQLSQRMAQLNAAIAALLTATADQDHPDYTAAEQAVCTVNELLPQVVKEMRVLSAVGDERSLATTQAELRALCDAARALCDAAGEQDAQKLNEHASKLANASGNLIYIINPRTKPEVANEILRLSKSAHDKVTHMAIDAHQAAKTVGGDFGAELDKSGEKTADAARVLLTSAQLTAPCISDPYCQSTLMSATDGLFATVRELSTRCDSLKQKPQHATFAAKMDKYNHQLQKELLTLKGLCQHTGSGKAIKSEAPHKETERLQFINAVATSKNAVDTAQQELVKPLVAPANPETAVVRQLQLSQRMAQLNAAIAALLAATADEHHPDYIAAEQAVSTVNELLPQVVKEMRALSAVGDERSLATTQAELRALCDAARALCDAAGEQDAQKLNEHATRLANASGKLIYVVNPRTKPEVANKILKLSKCAHDKAAEMVEDAHQAAKTVGGDVGIKLDESGRKITDAARVLLTSAQLTAPCIAEPHCQSTLLSAADSLFTAVQELTAYSGPLKQKPQYAAFGAKLDEQSQDLNKELQELKSACENIASGKCITETDTVDREEQRLQFLKIVSASKSAVDTAQKELNKPLIGPPLKGEAAAAQQLKLSQRMAQLNAAIAALITATSGCENVDYVTAERAVTSINELLPRVVKESKVLSASLDDASRAVLIGDMRGLCTSTHGLCQAAGEYNTGAINDYAANCANTMGKLYSVVNPNIKPDKEQEIIHLSTKVCGGVSQMLATVYQLAEETGGDVGARLDKTGARTADAAKTLLSAAQLTAPYIHEAPCQSALISAVEGLSSSSKELSNTWESIVKNPRHAAIKSTLEQQYPQLRRDLELLMKACNDLKTVSPIKKQPPAPPKRTNSRSEEKTQHTVAQAVRRPSRDINQEFLDRIRCEESLGSPTVPKKPSKDKVALAMVKTDDEKTVHRKFVSTVEDTVRNIHLAEEDIKKVYATKSSARPTLDKDQTNAVQKSIEQKLGRAAAAVSLLLTSNKSSALDCAAASKSLKTISDLMPSIAQDIKTLDSSIADKDRKAFLEDCIALFASSNKLCDSVTKDRKKLNELAVDFGNKSTKLLYGVCTDVDPAQEKEVVFRARAIGDGMSRLVRAGARAAAAPSLAPQLCAAAGRCADSASALAYTAKLVAPSIQVPECESSLEKASDELTSNLKTFSASWQPLASDPQHAEIVQEMSSELENLERLLQDLKQDLESGKLVKIKEKVVIEETPLRQLAISLLENAEKRAESPSASPEQKRGYTEYASALKNAIEEMDLANWTCRRSLHDTEKRMQLENAVQNLQITALQGRPSQAGKPQNNIVNLTDYVKDLSTQAEEMMSKANKCSSNVQVVKDKCDQIKTDANHIIYSSNQHNREIGATDVDIDQIDRFGRDCSLYVHRMKDEISKVADIKEKGILESKMMSLEDTLNLLRFVTQSAAATTGSASLDETLNDLTDMEMRIQQMLLPADKLSVHHTEGAGGLGTGCERGRSQVVAAASSGNLNKLAPAFLAYADDMRANTQLSDPAENKRLKEHLQKMIHLLKVLTVTTSRRVATWQEISGPELATVTEQLLKEIDTISEGAPGKKAQSVLTNIDANKLLLFTETKVEGDKKHIQDKLQQSSIKLSSMLGTVVMSTPNPQSLTRSLKATVDAATEMTALARALKANDPVQNAKIEEAVREMNFHTYNVVKTSDLVNQDPKNRVYRKRLLDACRMLNESINKLGRVTSAHGKDNKKQQCSELTRTLQLQQGLLQGVPQPTCSMPYADCVEALQSQHEVIQKLNNEEPMSREEVAKTLGYVSSAVHNSTEYAVQCAYFLSLSERDAEVAKTGLVDVHQLMSTVEMLHEICYRILQFEPEQAKSEEPNLTKQVENLKQALTEGAHKSIHLKEELGQAVTKVDDVVVDIHKALNEVNPNRAKITSATVKLLDTLKSVNSISEHPALIPTISEVTTEAQQRCDDVLKNSRNLTTKTLSLIREMISTEDRETMTWVMFNTRKDILQAFEALVESIKENGKRAGVLETSLSDLEEETHKKSYVQIQEELACKWLKTPTCKPEVKNIGKTAAYKIIELAEKILEDLKDTDKEEVRHLTVESKQLLNNCSIKYTKENSLLLIERLKSLRKYIERAVVTMVVEDFMNEDEPLADLEIFTDTETDETKRKFLLERKIAELLAQLGRVKRTARIVADTGSGGQHICVELEKCTSQAELLAPMLVKAAQQRVSSPNDQAVIENYKTILAKYAESMSRVRELCDQSVDPMDFVQTAGVTMQRMREEPTQEKDNYQYASLITKLANRVINVGMTSSNAKQDPELQRALYDVQRRMSATMMRPDTRRSRLPDWRVTMTEVLRTTGEVESVLGGEMIFQKQPESNQPIFNAALGLHAAVREWSARDNDIVAVAKRMAVLMARLSDYMNNNRKRELIATSKKIVSESQEVADLARKLAHECSDIRIKNNLLQVCERIPTISGQLKMLTTVKGSLLGPEGSREDQEDVNMLIHNAQNLMLSIQEVVKAAAGASVKIMSQRGSPRVRWVRKSYY